jgi:hypothetical protein
VNHTISISDDAYRILLLLAHEQGLTPAAFVELWLSQQEHARQEVDRTHHFYTTDEFLRHLGMSDEEIQASEEAVGADADS